MRAALPLAAALCVLASASAFASASAGASLTLEGPGSVRADRATTVDLRVALALSGVVCPAPVDVPVTLRVIEAAGMRSASLALDEVRFRLGATDAAGGEWRREAQVPLMLWGDAASGVVRVSASYALPHECTTLGSAASGTASLALRVEGPAPEEPAPAPAAPRSESVLSRAPPATPASEPGRLPLPVVGALVGTLLGGVVVVLKRVRAARG